MTAAEKKVAKKSFPEAQRHTVAVKLRLAPDVAARLRAAAKAAGENLSETVSRLLT